MEMIIYIYTNSNTILLQISFLKLGAKYLSPVLIPSYEVYSAVLSYQHLLTLYTQTDSVRV